MFQVRRHTERCRLIAEGANREEESLRSDDRREPSRRVNHQAGYWIEGTVDQVAHFTMTAAFGRRGIPPRGLARRANTPGIYGGHPRGEGVSVRRRSPLPILPGGDMLVTELPGRLPVLIGVFALAARAAPSC
jgi:hypothetical protein